MKFLFSLKKMGTAFAVPFLVNQKPLEIDALMRIVWGKTTALVMGQIWYVSHSKRNVDI